MWWRCKPARPRALMRATTSQLPSQCPTPERAAPQICVCPAALRCLRSEQHSTASALLLSAGIRQRQSFGDSRSLSQCPMPKKAAVRLCGHDAMPAICTQRHAPQLHDVSLCTRWRSTSVSLGNTALSRRQGFHDLNARSKGDRCPAAALYALDMPTDQALCTFALYS